MTVVPSKKKKKEEESDDDDDDDGDDGEEVYFSIFNHLTSFILSVIKEMQTTTLKQWI